MKKLLFFGAFASLLHPGVPQNNIFNAARQPTPAFMRVIELWQGGYKHEPVGYAKLLSLPGEQQAQAVVELTQREWLRPAEKERWEVKDYVLPAYVREQFLQSFDALHCRTALYPQQKKYKAIVIFGAALKRVCTRIAYVMRLWQEGVRADEILCCLVVNDHLIALLSASVILCVCRWMMCLLLMSLCAGIIILPCNEAEMMLWVWSAAHLPPDLRALPVTLVNSRMKIDEKGNAKRPTTGDTLRDWVAEHALVGDYLGISNQPYAGYQDAVARWWLPKNVIFETVGSAAPADTQWSDYFDTLARWAWQEYKILERAASLNNAPAA